MSMREEFEAWAIETGETALSKAHMLKSEDGEYYNYAAKTYWKAWQASRAALAVKLGKRWSNQDGDWFEDEDGESLDYRETIQALEAAGVQVKT